MSQAFSLRLLAGAALLAAGAAAQAQSNVNIYGLLDVSAGSYQNAGTVKNKSVVSGEMSTSYLGFGGKEDLGGGLSAKFAIEGFLQLNTGASGRYSGDTFWARNAYAGLAGDFGSLTLGRNTTSLFVSTLVFNAFGDSFGFSPSIRHYFTQGPTLLDYKSAVSGDTGWSQSISYTTPNLSGLTAQVQVAGDGPNPGGSTSGRKYGGNVLYFGGPFAGTVAYQKVKPGTADGSTTWQLGASYDFTVVKLFAQYGQVKDDTLNSKYKLADVGVSVPAGPGGKILFQYGSLTTDAFAAGGTAYSGRKTFSLGYDYNLSKRTDVYLAYMHDHKTQGTASTAYDNGQTYALGVRHKF